jgi:hypothetical protein
LASEISETGVARRGVSHNTPDHITFKGITARQSDELSFHPSFQLALCAGTRVVMQGFLPIAVNEALAYAFDCCHSAVQGLSDAFVFPALVGFQQHTCAR